MKTKDYKMMNILGLFLIIATLMSSCYKEVLILENNGVIPGEGLEDWTEETHSKDATPNYELVFPQDKVNRIDIVISHENCFPIFMKN